jgi:hypothetical protein
MLGMRDVNDITEDGREFECEIVSMFFAWLGWASVTCTWYFRDGAPADL